MDVICGADIPDDIAWFENTDGLGISWVQDNNDLNFIGPTSVFAEDVDGAGDMDVLAAAFEADDITWWENRGGQFSLATMNKAPVSLDPGASYALLAITMTHLGRSGDWAEELNTFELLLEACLGTSCTPLPLTSA